MIIDLNKEIEHRTVGYSYTMAASPMSPASSEGAVPSMSADLGPEANPTTFMELYKKPVRIEEMNVSAVFNASEPVDTDGIMSIAGLSDLENFNVDLIWPANHWNFFASIGHLINVVDGVSPIAIDGYSWDQLAHLDRDWVMPNMVGNGWVLLKQFLSSRQLTFFELNWWDPVNAIKLNTIYDSYDLDKGNIISSTVNLNSSSSADVVTVHRYEYEDFLTAFREVTPKYEESEGEAIISVEAGETIVSQVRTTVSMSKLETNTPRCLDMIWDSVEYFTSIYMVVGNDDLPIKAKRWEDAGGSLWLEINKDDPTIIDVHVTGANLPSLGPFRIAASSIDHHDYSALHVYAKGVAVQKFPYHVHTGRSVPVQSDDEVEVDNPFLNSFDVMPDALYLSAREYAGFNWTMTFSVPPHQGVMLINDRVLHKGHWWRIDSATVTDSEVSYTCTEATEITHLNEKYGDMTVGEFNSLMGEMDSIEFAARGLNG